MGRRPIHSVLKSMYVSLLSRFPEKKAEQISERIYKLRAKPKVFFDPAVHPAQRLPRGVVTMSLDFEMAWAWRYSKSSPEDCVTIGLREREQVPKIIAAYDRYQIAATWATVGHLFLEKCVRGPNGLAHPELPRVPYFETEWWRFASGDWFQQDPCTDVRHDPAWYAPDLIEQIISSRVGHEMGCHSFSHVGFGPYCPEEVIAAELDACLEVMKPFNVRPTTLVFPGNLSGKFDLLAKKGFTAVRWFPGGWSGLSLPIRREEGIWGIPESLYLQVRNETRPSYLQRYLWYFKKCIDKAAETRLAVHIDFHPSLVTAQIDELLIPVLRYSAELREKGLIDVMTNAQLVEAMRTAMKAEGRPA